jgi:hypothetical protein
VSTVTFLAGLGALGTGILLVGLGWEGAPEAESGVAFAPVLAPTMGGVQVMGRF